jgi:hypothetical protein
MKNKILLLTLLITYSHSLDFSMILTPALVSTKTFLDINSTNTTNTTNTTTIPQASNSTNITPLNSTNSTQEENRNNLMQDTLEKLCDSAQDISKDEIKHMIDQVVNNEIKIDHLNEQIKTDNSAQTSQAFLPESQKSSNIK